MLAALAAAVLAVALLPFAWRSLADPFVPTPGPGGSLKDTLLHLRGLQGQYDTEIAAQSWFKNVSSTAALLVGAAAAAAAVLRTRQFLIVALGAISATIYGTQSLFYADTTIRILVNARTSLSCLDQPAASLAAYDVLAVPAGSAAQFTGDASDLAKDAALLAQRAQQARALYASQATGRTASLARLTLVLEQPDRGAARDGVAGALDKARQNLALARAAAEQAAKAGRADAPASPVKAALALETALQDAAATLRLPARLRQAIGVARRQGLQAELDAQILFDQANSLAQQSGATEQQAADAASRVSEFPKRLAEAESALNAAMATIHAGALRALAANEPAASALRQLLESAGPGKTPAEGGAARITAERGYPMGPPVGSAAPFQPLPFSVAIAQARKAMSDSAAEIGLAGAEAKRLQSVIDTDAAAVQAESALLESDIAPASIAASALDAAIRKTRDDIASVGAIPSAATFDALRGAMHACAGEAGTMTK
jgi:hypothetical protein